MHSVTICPVLPWHVLFDGAVPASRNNSKSSLITKIVPFGENDGKYLNLLRFLVAKSDFRLVFWIEKWKNYSNLQEFFEILEQNVICPGSAKNDMVTLSITYAGKITSELIQIGENLGPIMPLSLSKRAQV